MGMHEECYSIRGTFSVTVTKENLAAIRALESRLRDEYGTSFHDSKRVKDIAVGDQYTFGLSSERSDDDSGDDESDDEDGNWDWDDDDLDDDSSQEEEDE